MKSTTPISSYAGESVFVGIDVHKRTYSVNARAGHQIVKSWTTSAEPQKLAEQLLKYFPEATIHTAYEAGFSGFVLHRVLEANGLQSRVIHAAAVEVAANHRVKTDKRDAKKLAAQLEAGRLNAVAAPSVEQEHQRLLSRTRRQLVSQRTTCKNRLRMRAHQFGLIAHDDRRVMSHAWVEELLAQIEAPELRIALQCHWQIWKALDDEIAGLTQALSQQADEDPNEATYRSAPGVGLFSARILSTELGDLSRFDNERQLFSYTGLTPSEHSSGEKVRRGAITKAGNRWVRGILIEVAWRAINLDPSLASFFKQLSARSGKTKAIVAVARKLLGRIRAAFRKGQLYLIREIEAHPIGLLQVP